MTQTGTWPSVPGYMVTLVYHSPKFRGAMRESSNHCAVDAFIGSQFIGNSGNVFSKHLLWNRSHGLGLRYWYSWSIVTFPIRFPAFNGICEIADPNYFLNVKIVFLQWINIVKFTNRQSLKPKKRGILVVWPVASEAEDRGFRHITHLSTSEFFQSHMRCKIRRKTSCVRKPAQPL